MLHFDFNGQNYLEKGTMEDTLDAHLKRWESEFQLPKAGKTLGDRFQNALRAIFSKTGLRCVVLVDEYDKPLLEVMENPELEEHNKAVFKGFFSSLKSCEEYLQFVFFTGVTKFQKVSIFSDLNHLRDISQSREYAGICGITEEELDACFSQETEELAVQQQMTANACRAMLRRTYDGYRFHPDAEGIYNPFSLLNAFADGDFGAYWFETGTPTFLIRRLKATGFDLRKLTDGTLYASERMMTDYTRNSRSVVPLLYQTGYLTIVDYDRAARIYTLSFPNEEVKFGFIECLMPEYVDDCGAGSGNDIFTLRTYIESRALVRIRDVFTSLFANITYTLVADPFEHYFQMVIYLVFTLLGKYARYEMHTFIGRVDCVVEARNYIYLFEFKRDGSAEEALRQIERMEYSKAFAADRRKIFRIGVNFDSQKRMLTEWQVE